MQHCLLLQGHSPQSYNVPSVIQRTFRYNILQHNFWCAQEDAPDAAAPKAGGLLSSFVRNLGVNVVGTQALTLEDIQPALKQLKDKLMDRNVAQEIATKFVTFPH